MPQNFTGVDVHCDDGVGHRALGRGVVVARGNVENMALQVGSWRGPHGSAGWSKILRTIRGFGGAVRRLIDGVSLPDSRAVADVQCGDRATKSAARIMRVGCGPF